MLCLYVLFTEAKFTPNIKFHAKNAAAGTNFIFVHTRDGKTHIIPLQRAPFDDRAISLSRDGMERTRHLKNKTMSEINGDNTYRETS